MAQLQICNCYCYDYLQVSAQSGQAEEFIPSVNVQCVGSTMTIRVDTTEPFYGVIHGINRDESGCSVLGQGGRKTKLTIDLSIPSGAPGSCGVKYNPVSPGPGTVIAGEL